MPVIQSNVVYVEREDRPLHLDLYRLSGTSKKLRPAVVFLHGGGWRSGDRKPCRIEGMSEHGYVVASVEYRFTDDAPFPAALEDCREAVRWLKRNHERLGIDPERIGVVGFAAGGHLGLMLATTGDLPEALAEDGVSARVQAVVAWSAPTDIGAVLALWEKEPDRMKSAEFAASIMALIESDNAPERLHAVSPVSFVSSGDTPCFLIQGEDDPLVPAEQTQIFVDKMKETGVTVEGRVVSGMGHHPIMGPAALAAKKFLDQYLTP